MQHRGVGLSARMRLHIGEFGTEQRLGSVAGEVFHHVDVLTTAVVAPPGQSLGVLVGQHAALGLQHSARCEVLRGDHLQGVSLPTKLLGQQLGDIGVNLSERGRHYRGSASVRCSSHGRQCIQRAAPGLITLNAAHAIHRCTSAPQTAATSAPAAT
ncbi:Uncharacterised protein [Mycobacterium tuberculosis]|nr:Uncharacterised protein [Mycobacterium tuberculosis]